MIALKKTQRVFSRIGYIGNFLGTDVKLGDIYQRDDKQFLLLANISDLIPSLKLTKDKLSIGKKSNLCYSKESHVNVKFKGEVLSSHLAKGEVELNFRRKNSAFISLKDVVTTELKLELIREELEKLWLEKKYKMNGRHIIVSQIVQAASGTVIFSQDRNNKVILRSLRNETLSSVTRLGSGQVEFVVNSKAILENICSKKYIPMFKALHLKNNGKFELVG